MIVEQLSTWAVTVDENDPMAKALAEHAAAVTAKKGSREGTVEIIIEAEDDAHFNDVIAEAEAKAKADKPDYTATVDKLVADIAMYEGRLDSVTVAIYDTMAVVQKLCRKGLDANTMALFTEAGVNLRHAASLLSLAPLRSARFRLEEWKEEFSNDNED